MSASGLPVLVRGVPHVRSRIAVALPVYQGVRTLGETLDSVLCQDIDGLEVVVVDNASTDGTAALIAGIDDPRLTVWRNPVTVPMCENFNRVIGLARAPLVKLVPADDLLEPGALAAQVAALEEDRSLALVAGRAHLVDATGRMLARARFLRHLVGTSERERVLREVVRSGTNPIGGDVAVTFRRSAFTAVGGYRDHGLFSDLDLFIRMLDHGRFQGQATTVARFRIAAGTRSAAADAADYRAQCRYLAGLVETERDLLRRRDRAWSAVRAPMARWRRQALFAVARARHETASAAATDHAVAPSDPAVRPVTPQVVQLP